MKKMAREGKLERYGSSSSWADEVEREEREEAQKQSIRLFESKTRSRKPNPFGAARPREVVLEEKGVDWRKLDQDLDHTHSNLRFHLSIPTIFFFLNMFCFGVELL